MAKSKEKQLFELCQKFVNDNKINCAESVCQSDHVIENAYEFIEQVCDIVGYYEYEDDNG